MTKLEIAKLRDALRDVISEQRIVGQWTTRTLVDSLTDRYPEVVEHAKDRLIHNAVANVSREIMKRKLPKRPAGGDQLYLPGVLSHLDISECINRPGVGVDGLPNWMDLNTATHADLRAYLAELRANIQANQNAYKNYTDMERIIRPYFKGKSPDLTVGEVIRHLCELEKDQAA
ncbi:MAG: hypothetical protein AAF414_16255 [Pseudomonadota bacterium]